MNINKCPFCGSNNVDLERDPDDINEPENVWRFVVCHDCDSKGPSSTDIIEAVRLWNKEELKTPEEENEANQEKEKEFTNILTEFLINVIKVMRIQKRELERKLIEEWENEEKKKKNQELEKESNKETSDDYEAKTDEKDEIKFDDKEKK